MEADTTQVVINFKELQRPPCSLRIKHGAIVPTPFSDALRVEDYKGRQYLFNFKEVLYIVVGTQTEMGG